MGSIETGGVDCVGEIEGGGEGGLGMEDVGFGIETNDGGVVGMGRVGFVVGMGVVIVGGVGEGVAWEGCFGMGMTGAIGSGSTLESSGGGAVGMVGRGLLAGVGSGIGIGEGAVVGRGRRSSWSEASQAEKGEEEEGGEGPAETGAFSDCKMTLRRPCLRPRGPRTG